MASDTNPSNRRRSTLTVTNLMQEPPIAYDSLVDLDNPTTFRIEHHGLMQNRMVKRTRDCPMIFDEQGAESVLFATAEFRRCVIRLGIPDRDLFMHYSDICSGHSVLSHGYPSVLSELSISISGMR